MWDSVTSPTIGSLQDVGMYAYLLAAREVLELGPLHVLGWVPTTSMLADGLTKVMLDEQWATVYANGTWYPTEALLCRRMPEGKRDITSMRAFFGAVLGLDEELEDATCMDADLGILLSRLPHRAAAVLTGRDRSRSFWASL
jgi:hypothetical protein